MSFERELKRLQDAARSSGKIAHLDAPSNVVESAQFDILIKRDSANIAEFLPFPIFGVGSLKAGLLADVNSFLPAGVTLVAIQFGTVFSKTAAGTLVETLNNAQKLILQFNAGAAFDTVTVTCSSTPYPQFVESTLSDVFELSKIRYTISDITQTDQYSQQLTFQKKSIFGAIKSNNLTPTAFRKPQDMQTGIVDIDVNSTVDKETTIWGTIKNVAAFTVTLSIFVKRSVRLNANLL